MNKKLPFERIGSQIEWVEFPGSGYLGECFRMSPYV